MNRLSMKGTAAAVGTTSLIALMASANQSVAEDGIYFGFSAGLNNGDQPSPGAASEEYSMGQISGSVFVGIQRDMANGMFGGIELAFTGPTEGDDENNSSYEYAYDTIYTLDAKARVGKAFGSVAVYGFGGVSTGRTEGVYYGNDYSFFGLNIGAGAQVDVTDNMFAGVEYIRRFTEGTFDDEDGYRSSHGTLSLRVGYKF